MNIKIKYFSLKIKNIFQSNGMLDSNIVYIPFNFFQEYFEIDNKIDSIELHVYHPLNVDKIIENVIKKINTPLLSYTWINNYQSIYHDVKKIKTIIYIILSLLVIISCFSIASISLMTISKKTRDIAILRSMGASNLMIQLIFLCYGLRSIFKGTVIGLSLGTIIIVNYKRIMFVLEQKFEGNILLDNIYYHNFFLLQINLLDVITIFSSTMIIGIIANWYPAYYASTINPSNILKEY